MLHWQVPKWLSGTSLVTRVIICSSVLHLCALIAIFVVYQGTSQFNITISGNMINPHSEIVFMPLHRSIKQSIGGGKSGNSAAAKASNKSSTTQVEKTIDVGGTTLVKIVQPKAKPKSKKELKKALGAKNEKATRPTPKATAGTEKEAAAKKDSTPESKVTTNEAKSESKVESKHVEQTNSEKNSQVKENSNLVSASSDAALGSSDTNIVYVGQAEMDALQAQEYIQQELAQHWAPPSGMRSDLFAIVTLTIDFEGVIKKVDLATSSGNLLFDTAAKKAAAQITPARWTFGKELSITFKP